MSFKIVQFLQNGQGFDLKELICYSIDSAVKLHSMSANNKSHGNPSDKETQESDYKQELSEIILFIMESMQADPECVSLSDLIQLVESVCYTAIRQSHMHIQKQGQQRSHSEQLIQSVYKLFATLIQTRNNESSYQKLKSRIQQECLDGLRYYSEEQRLLVNLSTVDHHDDGKTLHPAVFSMKDILGVLDHAFNSIQPLDTASECINDYWLEDCFQSLLDVLEFSEATTCSHISGILLPKLLKSSVKPHERLCTIWRRLLDVHKVSTDRTSRQTSNVYIVLCGLSQFFIPFEASSISGISTDQSSCSSDFLSDDAFWRVIQSGLIHTDPLARKQACFLMKRSIETASVNNLKIPVTASSTVSTSSENESSTSGMDKCKEQTAESRINLNGPLFWWSSEAQRKLLAMWGEFFLMYETLDEVQVHVVRPVMPRLTSLIQAASIGRSGGRPILHTSWLSILFSRCFVHETKTVSLWGLLQYLRLDIKACPLLQHVGREFLFGSVLPVLNDDTLYASRSGVIVTKSSIAKAFTQFMGDYVQSLGTHHTEVFLREFILAVSHRSWSPVSLTFIFDMLINLPACNAWGSAELQVLREMQFSCVSMLSFTFRSVMQCLMLQTVLRLLDKDGTSLKQLSSLLGLFSKCLHRTNPIWKQVCEWFEVNKHTQLFGSGGDIVTFLHTEVATMLTFDSSVSSSTTIDLGDNAESSRVACLVLIAADAHYANTTSSCQPPSHPSDELSFLRRILAPLVSVLASIGSHIYLPIIKTDVALQLLCCLLLHLNQPSLNNEDVDKDTDQVRQEMTILLSSCLEEIFSFITRRLLSAELSQYADISRVSLYISVLESIFTFLRRSTRYSTMYGVLRSGWGRMMQGCKLLMVQRTESKQKDAFLSHFQTFVACRLLLWLLQTSGCNDSLKLPWETLLPLVTLEDDLMLNQANSISDASSTASMTNIRKTSNLLLCTKWQCISELLRDSSTGSLPFPGSQPHDVILAACVRDLSLVKGSDAVPIMQCAKVLVNKVSQDSLCLDLVDAAWSAVNDEWRGKGQKFWHLYSAAVELIFQPCFLVAEKGTRIHDALDKVISDILTHGECKPKMITVFVKHLSNQWGSKLDSEGIISTLIAIYNHLSPLIDISIMGSRINKDIKLQQDISEYLVGLPYLQAVKDDITACIEQKPCQRRVILLNFLLLVATTRSHDCCQLITDFVHGLLKRFLELKTTTRRGYTINTQLHRQNIRLWQTLLVLVPYIQKDCANQILENVLSSVVREKQSSVQYLMIWVAVQLVVLEPSLEEIVWDHTQRQSRDTTESNICTLLIIIAHLGMVQPDTQRKECFYRRAFPVMMPWALIQTSSIRHLSLLCVKKAWQDCSKEGLGSVLEAFPVLRACMEFLQYSSSAPQSPHGLESKFFLFKVHPVQDYTIQTIFHIFPALCSLAEDDYLEPELFEKDCPLLWSKSNERIPTMHPYNQDGSQIQEQYHISLSIQHSSLQANNGGSPTKSTSPELCDNESNVQKKVIPWQDASKPGFDDVMRTGQEEQRSKGGSLVLVASLIDKAPNLGGLCRTSQIFGVSTLVVNSLRVTADKIFQSLSVTAEKWMPIIEVPVSDLASYLQAMRHGGYTLVGVEQTARSQCLTKYQFSERTLLLLGHERTGIPVELIQLLDVCVEIPQQGIIRSLNVHVSGALLVWEYTRQRLLTQMTKE